MPATEVAETANDAETTIKVKLNQFNAGIFLGHPMINLHLGGICLYSPDPVEQDTVVNVRFELPDGDIIEALGDVTWCMQQDNGESWLYGIHFLDLDAEEDDRLVEAAEALIDDKLDRSPGPGRDAITRQICNGFSLPGVEKWLAMVR